MRGVREGAAAAVRRGRNWRAAAGMRASVAEGGGVGKLVASGLERRTYEAKCDLKSVLV